jgi:hypothetical protein
MEILFRNKRNTTKLCMKIRGENIHTLEDYEIDTLKEILSLNEGYKWEPVRTGFAYDNNLPLIGA